MSANKSAALYAVYLAGRGDGPDVLVRRCDTLDEARRQADEMNRHAPFERLYFADAIGWGVTFDASFAPVVAWLLDAGPEPQASAVVRGAAMSRLAGGRRR